MGRRRSDVGKKTGIGQVEQFGGHVRLILEHIKAGRHDHASAKRVSQRNLVHSRAPAYIYQHTIRAKRRENLAADRMCSRGSARHHADERVHSGSEVEK